MIARVRIGGIWRTVDRRWLALAALGVVEFLIVLDALAVAVALPTIAAELGFSKASLQWVVTAYGLTFGGFLLLAGRAADVIDRGRLLIAGFAIFAAASLLGGLAPTAAVLVGARALQGVGAAICAPTALAFLAALFEEGPLRSRALAIWSVIGSFGLVAGAVLGGLVTAGFGWRWILLLNVPLGIVGIAALRATIPAHLVDATRSSQAAVARRRQRRRLPLERRLWRCPVFDDPPFAAGARFQPSRDGFRLPSARIRDGRRRSARLAADECARRSVGGGGWSDGDGLGHGRLSAVSRNGSFVADVLPGSILVGVGVSAAYVPITVAAVDRIGREAGGLASGLYQTTGQIGGALLLALLAVTAAAVTAERLERGEPSAAALSVGFSVAYLAGGSLLVAGVLVTVALLRDAANGR